MALSLNKVTLIGNTGKEPEIRSSSIGEFATLTIATSESWKDKATGERKDKTEWHRVVIYNESIVNVVKNYVKKGSKVYLEGALQTRKWVDNSGVEKYTTEIVLNQYNSNFILLDSREQSSSNDHNSSVINSKSDELASLALEDLNDEVPF
jgi:single-strand DNA-binding protein